MEISISSEYTYMNTSKKMSANVDIIVSHIQSECLCAKFTKLGKPLLRDTNIACDKLAI